MTNLAEISELLDARNWLREQIIQWRVMTNLTASPFAQSQLTSLTMLDNEMATMINALEGKLAAIG